ncbi:WD-repeat containing protein [Rhodopirellula islandica]|uniref:WD-repeat containing protein n=1 Tax=Rhodopirellula islandica TaxID=595434 RepID=A0A0J1BL64_RHOIS|nr:c-type cytochrome domain-containing protein [Rhodopirellula islandica]KLU07247.1 WD-repeat containing protein [Rhodopirellula islandica]
MAVDFAEDVAPILQTYCVGCHAEDDAQGGLAMDTHASLMNGGESGLALTPGVASSSRMFLMASGKLEPVMPPDDMEGPSEEELAILAEWIENGAEGPEGEMPIRRALKTPKIATASHVALPVTAIAQSADGAWQATARFGSITLVHQVSGEWKQITNELGKINSLSFNQDGSQLLAASGLTGGYGQATLFNVADGTVKHELMGHDDVLYAAKFSPDGKRIATAGYDRKILIWDAISGEMTRELVGHNGAIFDLAFSPDGGLLISACADETAKVWHVESGERLDTLSQPEGEVNCVLFSKDGRWMLAGSADNRLRVWQLISKDGPAINPIVQTRFVDESPIARMALTPDGHGLVILSEAGNAKVLRTDDWSVVGAMKPLGETPSDLVVSADGANASISLMDGRVVERRLPGMGHQGVESKGTSLDPVYLDLGPLVTLEESGLSFKDGIASVPRGVQVTGTLAAEGQADCYRFSARRGEAWVIEADATSGDLDPKIMVLDEAGQPLSRARLQAVRDTYFTFRGKNSNQVNDFRLFGWQEIGLNQYLYSNGEVTRTWRHPRGPDSGFDVYPGSGNRLTYFGTTHTTHALGEPAYVVRELGVQEEPEPNGLPVFEVFYENDDDPSRIAGKSSRLQFVAPRDGEFTVCVRDTRGHFAEDFQYRLRIRPSAPSYVASMGSMNPKLLPGAGRKIDLKIQRIDGFDGPVSFEIGDLPSGWHSNFPVVIEPNQFSAEGLIFVPEGLEAPSEPVDLQLIASAEILNRRVERKAGTIQGLTMGAPPSVIPMIQPIGRDVPGNEDWTLVIPRGTTVSARIVLRRGEDAKGNVNKGEVRFGKEGSGHNAAHGVYVDNIGLSGLLVLPNENEREFFITADPVATPGKRSFFLLSEQEGGVASFPITVEIRDVSALSAFQD